MAEQVGKVYLVGSGPGDAAYLTLQAREILARAEVLIYDALVDGDLIDLVPDTCLKLDVGKRGGQPSTPQSEINRLIVEHCQQGKQVVRLKNGDPFIFGRAQSEIGALRKANCVFEIIPGLSSALVAPLMAGIPLTDPQLSRSFTVVTAHDPDGLDWVSLAKLDTLVFLMGGRTLPEIVRRLRGHGRSPTTPVAIIRYAGRPEQQIWDGTLNTILDKTAGEALAPCVVVIGEVVKLRAYVGEQGPRWRAEVKGQRAEAKRAFSEMQHQDGEGVRRKQEEDLANSPTPHSPLPTPIDSPDPFSPTPHSPLPTPATPLPLADKTILVTRAASQSRQFTDLLAAQGARVIEMPTLEIGPPSSWRDLDRAIARIDDFDWLILTSTNAVDYFFERLEVVTGERAFYSNIKIAVVGEKTAQRLIRMGIQPDFVPPNFVADSLVANFPEPLGGLRVLFPRVESGGREVLVKEFTSQGAKVREVAAYESRCPDAIAPQALKALQTGNVDVVTFASSKTVKHFCQLLQQVDDHWQRWLKGIAISSIGPQTSQACETLLGRVDVEAVEYTLDGLTDAIIHYITTPIEQPVHQAPIAESPAQEEQTVLEQPENTPATEPEQPTAIAEPSPTTANPIDSPPVAETTVAVNHELTQSKSDQEPATSSETELEPISYPTSTEQVLARVTTHSSKTTANLAPAEVSEAVTPSIEAELIEMELVPDFEEPRQMETIQVELASSVTDLLTAEANQIPEVQAVVPEENSEPTDH